MHKPIHKYVSEITDELTKGYELIPKYHTSQKIIIPIVSSSSSEVDEEVEEREKTTEELFEKSKRHQDRH
jgi:hypothetical protein